MQPLIVNVEGKKVVIVGGGKIAARKAETLSIQKATLIFISPFFCDKVLQLCNDNEYQLIHREARPNDFEDAFLVILATNDRQTNHSLAKMLSPNQLVCVVDKYEEGNVTFPAVVKRGHLLIAVTTNGSSPKLSRKLKHEFDQRFDHSWVTYSAFLLQCRRIVKELNIGLEEKNRLLEEILEDRYRIDGHVREQLLAKIQDLTESNR
ncbi:NAD(P)-dependent oxidoreductase [Ferdinandcohnia quinoae]|uniref:precorrin-2 dehydrogenase n=1 Tax=Fredinandcohnia quinoae TaxID=2918902 RepID=A0AAW5DTS1_9BACI|nr:NAD(P)-dependent oxidoreductase [Fredinandcohnia sp. SECRCQ15]MCH1624045.1 potassium transporter Trk [Fredinandcohnia sp. SECRCQ15]